MDERIAVMGNLDAVGSGFSSFFSIWQVCILQISPFFLAYVIGLFFAGSLKGDASLSRRVILPALFFTPGFAATYAVLTMTGLPIGRTLIYNQSRLELIAGGYILLASLSLIFAGRFAGLATLHRPLVLSAASLVLGIAFALVYSPCITPALSKILGLAFRPETALRGGTLAFLYALGICLALTITCIVVVYLLARVDFARRRAAIIGAAAGLVLAILATLNLSGTMVYYKAFFLGFLVE